jgi:hypothetical protein
MFALLYPRLSAWLHGVGAPAAGPVAGPTGVAGATRAATGAGGSAATGVAGATGAGSGATVAATADAAPEGGREDAPVDGGRDVRGADVADARGVEVDDDEDEESLLRKREPDVADKVIGEESAAIVPAAREATRPKSKPEPARASKSPPAPTSVRIDSKPDGAVVKLGNRVFGRAPLSLRFNPGVTYELIFVKSGYVTARKRFNVTGRAGQKVTATLKKKPQRRRSFFERLFGR